MRISKKIITVTMMCLLVFSTLSIFYLRLFQVSAQKGMANLTGKIYDDGVDTDDDGAFNYLKIGVEVNVTDAGTFRVKVSDLYDSTYNYISVSKDNFTYLEVGIHVVKVSLYGPSIYLSGFNPSYVSSIYLVDEYNNVLDSLHDVPLSEEYSYTEFDLPPAFLTGNIDDEGVDTDGDFSFNYLEVRVEVNVTDPGNYLLYASGLLDVSFNYIDVADSEHLHLDAGLRIVNLSFSGQIIYHSGINPSRVSHISLRETEFYIELDTLDDIPLSKEYSYTEFDVLATLTGKIYDEGVDTDGNLRLDYVKIGVEVNVTDAGVYIVSAEGLNDTECIRLSVSNYTYLDAGVQVVNLLFYGQKIYASEINFTRVSYISLFETEYYQQLDSLPNAPLSRQYNFTEFDFQAVLTGTIYDKGVDKDGDGAFDYLEVGVEVNVNDAGNYEVQIWDLRDSSSNYISVSGYKSEYLDAGIQVVNVSLYGPTIHVSGRNPINVSYIDLYSVEYDPFGEPVHTWLDSISHVPLSKEYLYTQFDSPFNDMQAIFVVYPDGRVAMGGTLNYTHMEPPNPGPSMYGVAEIKKDDTVTVMSANFSFIVPQEEESLFPFNSSAFTLLSEYSSGLLTSTISGSTIFPPSIASEFPFNATDFTVMAGYAGNMVTGNITVDVLPSFPLYNVEIDFQGNYTYVYLKGSTKVVFGNYPEFGELNATVLEQLLQNLTNTIGGQGPNSLYNMTNGLLEFTMLNNMTTLLNNNATVNFEAKVEGDLTQTLVYLMANSTDPSHPLYKMLNATLPSFETASLQFAYARAVKEADMNIVFVVKMTNLIDSMVPILPEIPDIPPEMLTFIEFVLNTTYCSVESAQVSLNYKNGQAALTATATIQDNFNAEINHIKSMFLTYLVPPPSTSQLQAVNETKIDINNFRVRFNLTETTLEGDVSGFAVFPPLDWINATNFKLEKFFNITASEYEYPMERDKLKVTVEGGSNATHTVTIFRPGTVPEPDISAPGGMIWHNQSISGLKDLIFKIGPRDEVPPVIGTPIHTPEIPGDGEAVTVSVNVTDAYTGVRPDGVILSYRTDGGAWNNVTMGKTTGNAYEGIILGLPAGTHVEYRIIAYDYANNEAVEDKAREYYVYTVIHEFPTWQILAFVLLLIGIIIVFMKRRQNITGSSLIINQLFLIISGNS